MNIWEFFKRVGVVIVGIFVSSLILAIIIRLALGWDFRVSWGIFLLVCTASTALILEHGNYIPKIPARIIAGIFLALSVITVWPGFDYIIAKTTGETTARSYIEFQADKDLRIGEATRPKTLQGRETMYRYKIEREVEIRGQLEKDLELIKSQRKNCESSVYEEKQRCLGYTEEDLHKMEIAAKQNYSRRIDRLNSDNIKEPAIMKINGFGVPSAFSLAAIGIIAVIAVIGFWLWKKDGAVPAIDGKKQMRPGLIILAFAGYAIYFWIQYAFLRYWIVEWTGMSPFSVTLLLTIQQIIIIGILYYLIEPLMPEPGKVRYAFVLISVFGALNLYVGYAAYPYEFFDFKTGESRFWVSDEENKVYYAPGYSKLYGTPLHQGTKEDAIKYKSQIDNSLFASPLKKLGALKVPKIFGENMPTPAAAQKTSDGGLIISASAIWVDTGKGFREGETVDWRTHDTSVTATDNPSDPAYGYVDANGWRHSQFFDAVRPHFVNGCPTMALVGRVGKDGDWFCMKSEGRYIAPKTGNLYVAFNDAIGFREGQFKPEFFRDNAGEGTLYLN